MNKTEINEAIAATSRELEWWLAIAPTVPYSSASKRQQAVYDKISSILKANRELVRAKRKLAKTTI